MAKRLVELLPADKMTVCFEQPMAFRTHEFLAHSWPSDISRFLCAR